MSEFRLPLLLHRKGCAMLAVAVVRQAIKDWKDASETLEQFPENRNALEIKADCETFFKSTWFEDVREFAPDVISVDLMEVLSK